MLAATWRARSAPCCRTSKSWIDWKRSSPSYPRSSWQENKLKRQKCVFTSSCEKYFLQSISIANTPNRFVGFFLICQIYAFHICIYLRNWGVEGAMCKFLEFLDQHPQRNNLSKLATFDPILQRPHSAVSQRLQVPRIVLWGCSSIVIVFFCHCLFVGLLITLIKSVEGHKSLGALFEGVF